jgi:hypothetical protein
MADLYEKTYHAALDWAKRHYPNASKYHVAAFGDSVVYLVTGASTSLGGGPSIREVLSFLWQEVV